MSFLSIPIATTRNSLLSDGLLFSKGIIWGTTGTERGQAYRTQNVYIGANVEGVYLAAYPFTAAEYPSVAHRTVICSYRPVTCYLTPSDFVDVSDFGSSNVPYFGEINTNNLANNVYVYQSLAELQADFVRLYGYYPITYSFSNSTVSGPSEATVGDTVTVSAVPDVGYGITDASSQIFVTNNDVAVPYTWDAVNNHITFTMPNPS